MKFTVVTSLLAAASSVSALPTSTADQDKDVFGLLTLRSASPIHFNNAQAWEGNLMLQVKEQGAFCRSMTDNDNVADFFIWKSGLYLYGDGRSALQQIYVDRSVTGQGKIGYFNQGEEEPPKTAELKGWSTNHSDSNDYLLFDGEQSFIACPSVNGSYSIWANAGIANPGGNTDCLEFSNLVTPIDSPDPCIYS